MHARPTRLARLVLVGTVAFVMSGCGSAAPVSVAPTIPPSPSAQTTTVVTPASTPSPSSSSTVVGPGETWIAFKRDYEIHLIRSDGSGDHIPLPEVLGGAAVHPDLSPDGYQLSFSMRGETDVIWVGDVDGSDARMVVDCQAPCVWADEAAFSPDGGSLAYHRMVADPDGIGTSTLEITDLATDQARVVLTAPKGRAFYQPRWSPDGSRVVTEFVKMASSAFDSEVIGVALAIVDVTAAAPKAVEITEAADLTNSPDWSWATDTIVFSRPSSASGFDGPSDLVTIRPDGSATSIIASVKARGGKTPQSAWMPDGRAIVFVQPDGSVATVGLSGTPVTPLPAKDREGDPHPRVRVTQ